MLSKALETSLLFRKYPVHYVEVKRLDVKLIFFDLVSCFNFSEVTLSPSVYNRSNGVYMEDSTYCIFYTIMY